MPHHDSTFIHVHDILPLDPVKLLPVIEILIHRPGSEAVVPRSLLRLAYLRMNTFVTFTEAEDPILAHFTTLNGTSLPEERVGARLDHIVSWGEAQLLLTKNPLDEALFLIRR